MEDRKPLADGESKFVSTAGSRSGDLIFSEHKIELAHNNRHYQSEGIMPFFGIKTNPDFSNQSVDAQEFQSPVRRSKDRINSSLDRSQSRSKTSQTPKGQIIIPEPFAEGRPMPWEKPLKEEARLKLLDDMKRRYDRSFSKEKRGSSHDKAEKIDLFSVFDDHIEE